MSFLPATNHRWQNKNPYFSEVNLTMKYLVLLLLVISLHAATAQVTQRNILRTKFSEADVRQGLIPQNKWKPFPQTPAEWKAAIPDSLISTYIAAGEVAAKKKFESIPATVALEYVRSGNRTHYQDLSFAKRNQLWSLMLAESMEGKGRFTDQIINGVWSLSEETFWGIPAHLSIQKKGYGLPDVEDPIVDLFAAETGAVLAWTDYFVGSTIEKASPLARARINTEVNRRIFKPMLASNYSYLGKGNPNAVLNNWAPWVMANFICTSLLLEKDETKRAGNVLFAMKYVDQYINGLGEDGGCDEGPAYWFAAGGAMFDCLNFISDASAGKLNAFKDPFIAKVGAYIYKVHIDGNRFINIADAPNYITADGLMIYRFGKAVTDPKMMAFGSEIFRENNLIGGGSFRPYSGLYNLMVMNEAKNHKVPFTDLQDVWFSDLQLMSSRTRNGLFVASHGGHNAESHNHNDVGDFILYSDGDPVIIDAGAGAYTARTFSKDRYRLWFNTSSFHNLPTIDGLQQSPGAQAKATSVSYSTDKNRSSLTMDLAKAYPAEAQLSSWTRKVQLEKKGSVTVTDQFVAKIAPNSLTQTFMTVCETDISKPGQVEFAVAGGKKVYMNYDPKSWTVTKEQVKLETPEDENFKAWGKPIWRVLLTAKGLGGAGKFVYSFHK
ncbi:MAG: Heparinase family protein [Sphingobacteriaceae bacterium]|jgi:hypothetical protein|nr:Heparinase family protein [Sphingobacteriaceae bacterium]